MNIYRATFMDKFDTYYLPKLGVRAPTFRAVIREALARSVSSIVETGCTRKKGNWHGDGQSTVIWNDYNTFCGGWFRTIDNSEEALRVAEELAPEAICLHGDSVKALSQLWPTAPEIGIDLLYLDSLDLDVSNDHSAAKHCLMELLSARPRLHTGSIVFIDDSPVQNEIIVGKARYVAEYFTHLGVVPFTTGYQAAWIMP